MKIIVMIGLAAASLLAVLSLPVQAQTANPQTACRGVYLLGEKVPAGCQSARKGGPPEYRRWGGDGHGTTSATPPPDNRRPSDYGLYHFGGHNALYGFGR